MTEVLFDDPLVVVAGRKNNWMRRPNIELSDPLDEEWVLPPFESISG